MTTLDALIDVANRLWERRAEPRVLFVSQWQYDVLEAHAAGRTLYLAMKRADLNEQRRRQARPAAGPNAFAGIDRSVWS